MTVDENTKDKILKTARVLFADHGFDGTSVRDIAKAANVNVASVNYHFSSKENLFHEILSLGYRECSEVMRNFINKNNTSLEEALIYLFRHFMERSHDLVSSFKFMMSADQGQQIMSHGTEDEQVGPPGGKAIGEALRREVGTDIGEEDLQFAIRTLFSHVTHQAIIFHCCFKDNTKVPFSTSADIEKGIRRLTKLIVTELRSPSAKNP